MKFKYSSAHKPLRFLTMEILFLGPILIIFFLVKVLPFLLSFNYAFTDWDGVTRTIHNIGFNNFVLLARDKEFLNSLWFTLKFSAVSVVLTNVLGFIFAYFLSKPIRLRGLIRCGLYIPNVLGGLILGFIWQFIFTKVIPAVGQATGWPLFNLMWLGTPETSFWALVIVESWSISGYFMLLYIAGFATVPEEFIEAAHIDGAGSLATLFKVTVPLMMSTISRCLLLSIISISGVYTLNMSLTDGGPYLSSEGAAMNIYRTAFTENNMGYGTAKSLVFLIAIVLITSVQVHFTSKKEVSL